MQQNFHCSCKTKLFYIWIEVKKVKVSFNFTGLFKLLNNNGQLLQSLKMRPFFSVWQDDGRWRHGICHGIFRLWYLKFNQLKFHSLSWYCSPLSERMFFCCFREEGPHVWPGCHFWTDPSDGHWEESACIRFVIKFTMTLTRFRLCFKLY